MPRSHLKFNGCRALAALVAFAAFVSPMLMEAWAQGGRTRSRAQLQPTTASANPQQARRKSIASVRSFDTRDGSRITITSDVPLNDYAAYMSGDRFYVVIPDADIIYQNVQTLQASLRGQGFQDVRIEKRGSDLVFSFRLRPGMRARPEQKFNRLDVIFTAPPGSSIIANRNTRVEQPNTNTGGTSTRIGVGNQQSNTSGTYSTGTGSTGTSTGGGGGRRTGGRTRGGYRGYSSGYRSGGGGGGGGAPLNIPLPSDMQPEATPSPTPSAATSATPSASTAANANEGAAQTTASPESSPQGTPAEIAQNQPQQPATAPPSTSTTTTTTNAPAPATSETSFAAAIKDNWLPLLIGLLVLLAIGLLLVSRSRADRGEAEPERLQTTKRETIKEKPVSATGARLAGGAATSAGAAGLAAAAAKESRAKTAEVPVEKEEVKTIEPVAPAVGMEQISTEVKNLLEGKDYDEAVIGSTNPETRQLVSTELMAALASRNPDRRDRARAAFNKHGFFDEATRNLRTAESPAERISAARALGLTQARGATAHLTAALEDDDPEVRRAAVNALAEVRDPSAIGPLNALLEREKNRKVPHSLIRRAIEASATIDVSETPPAATAAAPPAAEPQTAASPTDKKDKDDEDREVFEI